jgi:hypothetical protein
MCTRQILDVETLTREKIPKENGQYVKITMCARDESEILVEKLSHRANPLK